MVIIVGSLTRERRKFEPAMEKKKCYSMNEYIIFSVYFACIQAVVFYGLWGLQKKEAKGRHLFADISGGGGVGDFFFINKLYLDMFKHLNRINNSSNYDKQIKD